MNHYGRMRTRRLPPEDDACGWSALLPPLPPARVLDGAMRADCAVIGAGFTGLAVARRLAALRPEWRIAVVDAWRVGGGASGRNSGFVVDLPHYIPARGVEGNRRLLRLGRAGLGRLRELVRQHAIDCEWTEVGRLHGAAGSEGTRALERFCAGADALGEPYERLDRAALAALIGSTYYCAGARTPGSVMVQPAALARGLARALPGNVDLFEQSPVRGIDSGTGFTLRCDGGTLAAARLFVASNGFTPALGFLRDRLFPLLTFASLTRPLSAAEAAALGGEPVWGLVSETPMGTTLRRLASGRLLLRNTVRYRPGLAIDAELRRRVGERHRRDFAARFPAIGAPEFDYTWGGVMGTSMNGAQFFGEVAPHLFVSAGYNGVGIAMGTISGELLADLALGAPSALSADMQALPPPDWIPPAPALGVGVRTTLAYLAKKAAGE
jgi:glycine/D-amino acid oxidase-like deaminating enzyme